MPIPPLALDRKPSGPLRVDVANHGAGPGRHKADAIRALWCLIHGAAFSLTVIVCRFGCMRGDPSKRVLAAHNGRLGLAPGLARNRSGSTGLGLDGRRAGLPLVCLGSDFLTVSEPSPLGKLYFQFRTDTRRPPIGRSSVSIANAARISSAVANSVSWAQATMCSVSISR